MILIKNGVKLLKFIVLGGADERTLSISKICIESNLKRILIVIQVVAHHFQMLNFKSNYLSTEAIPVYMA